MLDNSQHAHCMSWLGLTVEMWTYLTESQGLCKVVVHVIAEFGYDLCVCFRLKLETLFDLKRQ